jgi:hypothetical protein
VAGKALGVADDASRTLGRGLRTRPEAQIAAREYQAAQQAAGVTDVPGEALVPGGWMNVHREPTIPALRRLAAWCGLTIGPVEVAAELPEPIAAG